MTKNVTPTYLDLVSDVVCCLRSPEWYPVTRPTTPGLCRDGGAPCLSTSWARRSRRAVRGAATPAVTVTPAAAGGEGGWGDMSWPRRVTRPPVRLGVRAAELWRGGPALWRNTPTSTPNCTDLTPQIYCLPIASYTVVRSYILILTWKVALNIDL